MCDANDAMFSYGGYGDLASRRKNATRESTATLKAWLNEHKKNPYPTKGEKIMLAIITKMTLTQVTRVFMNTFININLFRDLFKSKSGWVNNQLFWFSWVTILANSCTSSLVRPHHLSPSCQRAFIPTLIKSRENWIMFLVSNDQTTTGPEPSAFS